MGGFGRILKSSKYKINIFKNKYFVVIFLLEEDSAEVDDK